jgi:hypothetical protein
MVTQDRSSGCVPQLVQPERAAGAGARAGRTSPPDTRIYPETVADLLIAGIRTLTGKTPFGTSPGGEGVEHVVDALPKSVSVAACNARITFIGAFPATAPVPDPFADGCVSIRRIAVGSRTDFEAAHWIRPVIDRESCLRRRRTPTGTSTTATRSAIVVALSTSTRRRRVELGAYVSRYLSR